MTVNLKLGYAAARLAEKLQAEPMFLTVGVTETQIIVYVACTLKHARDFVPSKFEDYSVIMRQSAKPRPVKTRFALPKRK